MKLSTHAIALISLSGGGVVGFVPAQQRLSHSASAFSKSILRSTTEDANVEIEATTTGTSTVNDVKESSRDVADPFNGDASSAKSSLSDDKSSPSPGTDENFKFDCEDSVEFWRNFQSDGFWSAQENVRELGNIGTRFAQLGPEGLSYWLRHAGRSGYFAVNALLGNKGFQLHERLVNNKETTFTGALPFNMDSSIASRLFLEAALCYEQDFAQIKSGEYKEPWDMKPNHRQSSPVNVVTQTGRFINEAIGTLGRRIRGEQTDKDIWITDSASPSLYPDYYRTAFHYQSDGWMSKKSADVYETSTETLFLGRQDSMQRAGLPPIVAQADRIAGQRPMKILEVACGTGRFMTFVRDNLPLDTEYTAVDLSPYYLDAARDNDSYWRKTRRDEENRNGGNVGRNDIKPARLVQAQAENLPFDDESFDAVVCVYLYHELPREVRARVSAEMSRVLKQDGTLVLTDSIQRGDRPALDEGLSNFENMNEPFYRDYCADDLPGHFEWNGLHPMTKALRSTTKSLSFSKPICEVGECETSAEGE